MRARSIGALVAALVALAALSAPAQAAAAPNRPQLLKRFHPPAPPGGSPTLTGKFTPAGTLEDACGVAVDSQGDIYVSDYYHHAIDVFDSEGGYLTQIANVDPLDGPCGLAVDSAGNLYVNDWHRDVVKYAPSQGPATIDSNHSTGVAVDPASGDVYVDDRTYVAVYEAPVGPGEEPALKIGQGSLGDAYGVAVSDFPASDGSVYVADATTDTVKVFDPAVSTVAPVSVIDGAGTPEGGFASLFDASLAIDQSNGNLLVADNTQAGFEHPLAVVDEFGPDGAYRGRLGRTFVDAEPVGIAVDPSPGENHGDVYVTSGNGTSNVFPLVPNSEESVLYAFGPAGEVSGGVGGGAGLAAASSTGAGTPSGADPRPAAGGGPGASASEAVQRQGLRVAFDGSLAPHSLPRSKPAPVRVSVAARISTADSNTPARLGSIEIAINRYGRFDPTGLPVCELERIQPATTADALAACRRSLVGQGSFSARILFRGQAPFPSAGKVYAFNGELNGRPAILAHVYGTDPAPTSYTIPFLISGAKGTFGTVLRASLPQATSKAGYVTGLSLTLGKTYSYRSHRRSYLTASCPAPKGFPGASFPFARAAFGFAGGPTLRSTLTRSCRVRG